MLHYYILADYIKELAEMIGVSAYVRKLHVWSLDFMASIMKVKFVSDLSKSAIGRYSISKQFQSYKEKKKKKAW